MWIDSLVLHLVFSDLWASLLQGEVLLEALKLHLVGLVLVEAHILGQNDAFGDLCPHLVQVSLIEHPVLRKKDLVR